MKILFMAAEAAPFAKVGGLADVAGALPQALAALGHEVWLLIPRHPGVAERADLRPRVDPFILQFDWQPRAAALYTAALPGGVTLATLVSPDYFDRADPRGGPLVYRDWDDDKRYIFFARAGLEAVRRAGWQPDLVHAHDWSAAAAINWLKVAGAADPFYGGVSTVYTIHNLAYQGNTDLGVIGLLGVEAGGVLPIEWDRFGGRVNLMARGITYADLVTTVSPTYAQEILTPAYGEGLDGLLRARADRLVGILNGLDTAVFDPARDPHLAATFTASRLQARAVNKRRLQEQLGLPVSDAPLIGIVSRLADQKGFDLLARALDRLLALGVQIALLGTGEPVYHTLWAEAARQHPAQVAAALTFDAALAQLIYGGSDLFLMPSRFEPCGLGQMISMRYGSLPVVRATGGLVDTVRDADTMPDEGTGFVFGPYTAEALVEAVQRALAAFQRPERWRRLQRRAMAQDFSWQRAAQAYEAAFLAARGRQPGPGLCA